MKSSTIDLREHHMVTVVYDESVYRQGDRVLSNMLAGTPEQIGEAIKKSVIASLSYGSHTTAIHVTPIRPSNVWVLEDES